MRKKYHQTRDAVIWHPTTATLPAPFTAVHWEMSQHGKIVDIRRECAMLGSDYEMLPRKGFPAFCISFGLDGIMHFY